MKFRLMIFPGRRVVGEEHEFEVIAREAAINKLPVMPGCSILIQRENDRAEEISADKFLGRQKWLLVDLLHRFPDGSALWENRLTEEQSEEWFRLAMTQEEYAKAGNDRARSDLANVYDMHDPSL